MKFLCTSCKAKYQIADEKVIGRTVKMKCRQCGYIIEINQALIDSGGATFSVPPPAGAAAQPVESAPSKAEELTALPVATKVAVRPSPIATKSHVPVPAKPPAPKAPPRAASAASPVAPRVAIAQRSDVAIERKSSPLAGAASPVRKSSPLEPVVAPPAKSRPKASLDAIALSDTAKSDPAYQGAHAAASVARGIGRLPGVSAAVATSLGAVEKTAKVDPLAGAFARAVDEAPAQSVPHPLAGDEWYVGISEQPVGPIRLAEIRERAAIGEITQQCLVWRDGLEDWRPLSAFPELVAVVEDGIASLKSQSAAAAAVVSAGARDATTLPRPAGTATPEVLLATHPVSAVQTAAAPGGSTAADESLAIAGLAQPKIPLAAWAAVAMALVLGVTIGIVFIKPEPAKQIVKYVEVPAKQAQQAQDLSAPAVAGAVAAGEVVTGVGTPGSQGANSTGKKTVAGGGSGEAVAAASAVVPQGLKGLSGLRGLGPSGGPQADGAVGAGSGAQLDSATLSKTVSRYTPSVKRSCWQPALDMRSPDAPTTARVTARITVGPSGKVSSVTTSGDPKGYNGLASCIQTRVRNWEFPPAGGSTEVNVPFVFAAQ